MKKILVCTALMSGLLTGCAMDQLNDTMSQLTMKGTTTTGNTGVVNVVSSGESSVPVGSFGSSIGYQPSFNISVPSGECDKTAFIAGFKDDYISYWNNAVIGHSIDSAPNAAGARKAKQFTDKYLIDKSNYQNKAHFYMAQGTSRCSTLSYTDGQSAGQLQAGHDAENFPSLF